jgi:O-antigen ligase/tetratricopeptide (TPR) repeat protein
MTNIANKNNQEKAVSRCQVAIEWLSLGLVFLVPVYFAFFHEIFNTFTLYSVVILRVSVALACLFLLAKIFLQGKISYRFDRRYLFFFGALAAVWLFSASFSEIKAFGFWGYYPREQGFLTIIFYLLFLLLLFFNLNSFSSASRLIGAMIFSSFFACLYGVIQYLGLDLIHWSETSRIFSTFGQPNFFGHFLILVIPFTLYALICLARRFLSRSLIGILLFSQIACLFLTYSRSAWVGLAAEIFAGVLIWLFLRQRKKIAVGLIILSLAGLVFVLSLASFSPRPAPTKLSLSNRLESMLDFSQGTVKIRINTWQAALAIFKEENTFRKLAGWGPDSLFEQFSRHYDASWSLDENTDSWPDRCHNLFLDILLSFGLIGLSVYLAFYLFLGRQVWLFLKNSTLNNNYILALVCIIALVGYFFNNLFSFSDTAQFLYFYLILGLLVFSLSQTRPIEEIKIGLTVFSRVIIFLSFLLLTVIFIFFYNIRMILADHYYVRAAMEIQIEKNCSAGLSNTAKAIVWGGGNSQYYQNGYLANGLACFNLISPADQEKLKDNLLFYLQTLPADKFYAYAQSRADVAVLLSAFDPANRLLAEKYFVAWAEKYPQVSTIYSDWGNFELINHDYDKAIEIENKGLATLPLAAMAERGFLTHRSMIESWQASFYEALGKAYAGKKDSANALNYFNKAANINPYYPPIYHDIADVYAGDKDWEKAIWYNKKGYVLNRADSSWPMALAYIYQEKGDKAVALDYFNQVIKLDPANQDAKKAISDLNPKIK